MAVCCQCEGLESQFGPETARRELRRFRRRGPNRSTQRLIDGVRAVGVDGASLLDIGGGVGAIHHTLLDAGATNALHVDVSPDYTTPRERRPGVGVTPIAFSSSAVTSCSWRRKWPMPTS